jgi:hypothetical protein
MRFVILAALLLCAGCSFEYRLQVGRGEAGKDCKCGDPCPCKK